MTEPVVLSFPAPTKPWRTNEDRTLHWAARAKRIKAWREAARLAAVEARVGVLGHSLIELHLPFDRGARRDPMNYVGTCLKAAVDGLVDAGLWPDDTPDYVSITQPVLVVRGDAVYLRITPLA